MTLIRRLLQAYYKRCAYYRLCARTPVRRIPMVRCNPEDLRGVPRFKRKE